jgi:hypothetical protein
VRPPGAALVAGSALGLAARTAYRLLTSGALTLDLDAGRRLQPLGPLLQTIRVGDRRMVGARVARTWTHAVRTSLHDLAAEAERRARIGRQQPG